ncbi:MAG: zf-HC2 domain-containing protein [Vicinamibacterales bacterium]
MTNDSGCTFGERRGEVLIAYLYDDIDSRDRTAFERHLSTCAPCRLEMGTLSDVRDGLAEWAAPDVADGIGGTAPRSALRLVEPPRSKSWRVLADAPIWMQAAAAMLVVAASLGLANINLTYTREGLSVTTGWMRPAPEAPVNAGLQPPTSTPAASTPAPWRADLTALEQQLRQQIAAKPALALAPAPRAPAAPDDEAVMKRVQALLQESERRQQSELALRVAEMARDSQAQRQADLVRIDRTLGFLQSRTGVEVMRTQQQLNNLAQRVSEQR